MFTIKDMTTKHKTRITIEHYQKVLSDLTSIGRNYGYFTTAGVKAGNLSVYSVTGQESCIVYSSRRGKVFIRKESDVIILFANTLHSKALLRNVVSRINNYFRDLPHG